MRGPLGLENTGTDSDRGTAWPLWYRESRLLQGLGDSAAHPPISSILVSSEQRVVKEQLLHLRAGGVAASSGRAKVAEGHLQGTSWTLHLFQDK